MDRVMPVLEGSTHDSGPKDVASLFGFGEDENECRNKRDAVAGKQVHPLEAAELAGGVAVEEGQIYIESHCQSPEGISRHEPVKLC